jgi:predicted methyltransferase
MRGFLGSVTRPLISLFLVLAACAQLQYEQMNDPARDIWQQPAAVMEALNVKEGDRVVDLGAGSGYFTFRFSNAVGQAGKVYAVDVDRTSLPSLNGRPKSVGASPMSNSSSPRRKTRRSPPAAQTSCSPQTPTITSRTE